MAHSNKNQPAFSYSENLTNRQKSHALCRDAAQLNNSLKVDFDQKLGELAKLLARFKAIVIAPSANGTLKTGADDISSAADNDTTAQGTVAVQAIDQAINSAADSDSPTSLSVTANEVTKATDEPAAEKPETTPVETTSLYAAEPARFETGLYKLNCQLYRFKLELDQEMEFREEPLHLHFRQQSDLSQVLQKISDESSEKHPGTQ